MAKDYRYEILKFLYENSPNTIDIKPLILSFVSEGHHSRVYFGTMIRNLIGKKQVWANDLITLSWSQKGVYQDDVPILARIEPEGIDAYFAIKRNYEPDKNGQSNNSAITISGNNYGPVSGIGNEINYLPPLDPHFPNETPNPNAKTSKIKRVAQSIGKFIWENILKILLAILTAYILLRLGLKK